MLGWLDVMNGWCMMENRSNNFSNSYWYFDAGRFTVNDCIKSVMFISCIFDYSLVAIWSRKEIIFNKIVEEKNIDFLTGINKFVTSTNWVTLAWFRLAFYISSTFIMYRVREIVMSWSVSMEFDWNCWYSRNDGNET